MRVLRPGVAFAIIAAGAGAGLYVWATHDARKVAEYRRRAADELAALKARPPERRTPLRGTPVHADALAAIEEAIALAPSDDFLRHAKGHLRDAEAAPVRSACLAALARVDAALACDSFPAVSTFDGSVVATLERLVWGPVIALEHDPAREGVLDAARTPVATAELELTSWALFEDLLRNRPIRAWSDLSSTGDRWLPPSVAASKGLDAAALREVRRQEEVLLAEHPSVVRAFEIDAAQACVEAAALEKPLSPGKSLFEEVRMRWVDAEEGLRRVEWRTRKNRPLGEDARILEQLARLEERDPAKAFGVATLRAQMNGLRAWARDLELLRLARLATLARLYELGHGRFASSLDELLGRAPGDDEREPLTGEPFEYLLDGKLTLHAKGTHKDDRAAEVVLEPR